MLQLFVEYIFINDYDFSRIAWQSHDNAHATIEQFLMWYLSWRRNVVVSLTIMCMTSIVIRF